LAGVTTRFGGVVGAADNARRFIGSPAGANELDLEQDLFGAVRLFQRLQLSLLVPIVETWRQVPSLAAFGGFIGDVQLNARYDFTYAGASRWLPGLALLGGFTAPSGRAPTASTAPLATDATGTGAWQLAGGGAVEQSFDRWLLNLTGTVSWRSRQRLGNVVSQLGVLFSVFAALAYGLTDELVLALTASYSAELDAYANDAVLPNTGRAATRVGLAGGYLIADGWRLQANAFADLPIAGFGRTQPVLAGGTLGAIRTW
jgi:hypothetical protein